MAAVKNVFVELDSLPIVAQDEDVELVEDQMRLDDADEEHNLNVGWLIMHPGERLPSLAKVRRFFKANARRTAQLLDMHKQYLADAPNTQRLALEQYQFTPDINPALASGKASVFVGVRFEVDLEGDITPEGVAAAIAKQTPVDQIRRAVKRMVTQRQRLERLIMGAPRLPAGEAYPIFRGVDLGPKVVRGGDRAAAPRAAVGDVLEWPRFTSFSISPMVALAFKLDAPCCVFRLQWDATVPAVVLPVNARFAEFEVLLPPGRYRVTGVTRVESGLAPGWGVRVLDLERLPEGAAA